MKVKSESEVAQSCPTLSDPMDCSPPGSSVHGIFQARVLEWGAIAFSHQRTSSTQDLATEQQSSMLWGWVSLPSLKKVQFHQFTKRLKSAMSPENLRARYISYVHWHGPIEMMAGQWGPIGSIHSCYPQPLHTFPYIAKIERICTLKHAPPLLMLLFHSSKRENSHSLKNSSLIEQIHVPTHSQLRSSKVSAQSLISSNLQFRASIKLLEGIFQ